MAFKYSAVFTYSSGITATQPTPIRQGGWTESFYADGYDNATYAAFRALIIARLGFCPLGTAVNHFRVQQVDPAGATSLSQVAFSAPATWQSDVPQMAIKIPFFLGTNVGQVLREFRGTPDIQVLQGEYQPTGPFTAAVQAFLSLLQG